MKYIVVTVRGQSIADAFADALDGKVKARSVYVVGTSEEELFAAALAGNPVLIINDPSSDEVLRFTYSEAIGTEDSGNPLSRLIEMAKERADALQAIADKANT